MDPLRKDEQFEPKLRDEKQFKEEKPKPAEISESAELERERSAEFERGQPDDAAYPGTKKAERLAGPMGPMPAMLPKKGELQEPKAARPQLVTKEAKGPDEVKKARFFAENDSKEMRVRWDKIQGEFVDQPRQAVEDADILVGESIKKLSEQLAEERSSLIRQWNSGESVSTEVLRQSLRSYRTFFERLLAA